MSPREGGTDAVGLKALWNQGSTLLTLLGLLAYVLGRLMVDGFYGQLHTTAEAAGVGYASILEPAAIATAAAGVVWAGVTLGVNALQVSSKWAKTITSFIFGIVVVAGGGGALVLAGNILSADLTDAVSTLLLTGAIPALGTLLGKIPGIRLPRAGEAKPPDGQLPNGTNPGSRDRLKLLANIAWSFVFLGGLLVAAHQFGVREGRLAAEGKPVNVAYFGFDIPSIGASVVRVQPITPSPAFKQLSSRACWLEIGSGPSGVLLYDPSDMATLTISPDQIVVTSANPSCMK